MEGFCEGYTDKGLLDKRRRPSSSLASTLLALFAISVAPKCASRDSHLKKTRPHGPQRNLMIDLTDIPILRKFYIFYV